MNTQAYLAALDDKLREMDAQNNLIARWDSAPHHKESSTFPFHKHTPQGPEEHGAITLLDALDEIAKPVFDSTIRNGDTHHNWG